MYNAHDLVGSDLPLRLLTSCPGHNLATKPCCWGHRRVWAAPGGLSENLEFLLHNESLIHVWYVEKHITYHILYIHLIYIYTYLLCSCSDVFWPSSIPARRTDCIPCMHIEQKVNNESFNIPWYNHPSNNYLSKSQYQCPESEEAIFGNDVLIHPYFPHLSQSGSIFPSSCKVCRPMSLFSSNSDHGRK